MKKNWFFWFKIFLYLTTLYVCVNITPRLDYSDWEIVLVDMFETNTPWYEYFQYMFEM